MLLTQVIPQNRSSQIGQAIARSTYDAAAACRTDEAAERVLWSGYDAILADPQTADDERTIARLGQEISRRTLQVRDHATIGYALTKAIANGLSGPFGPALASVIHSTASDCRNAESAVQVIWRGYDTLQGSSGTTSNEQAVVHLGQQISKASLPNIEHARIGYSILRSISDSAVGGPIGTVLAQVSYNAARGVDRADTANQVLWNGFAAIENSSGASEAQKAIAREAIEVSHRSLPNKEHSRLAYQYMRSIQQA